MKIITKNIKRQNDSKRMITQKNYKKVINSKDNIKHYLINNI